MLELFVSLHSLAICGDGIKTKLETCDDGNVKNFDGCTSKCTTEVGWACSTPGKPCTASISLLAIDLTGFS